MFSAVTEVGLVSLLFSKVAINLDPAPEAPHGHHSRAVFNLMAAQQFNITRLLAACGALASRFSGLGPYFSPLEGQTSLSLRGSQEVGVDAIDMAHMATVIC